MYQWMGVAVYYCPYMSPDFGLIPAGFMRRLIAAVVDQVMVLFAGFVLALMASPLLLAAPDRLEGMLIGDHAGLTVAVAYLLVGWIYFAGLEAAEGQATIGKVMTGIMVCDLKGERPSFGRASLRYLAKLLSVLTLGVGFLIMLWHPRKRTLHDLLSRTAVTVHLESPIVGPG